MNDWSTVGVFIVAFVICMLIAAVIDHGQRLHKLESEQKVKTLPVRHFPPYDGGE